MSNTQTVNGLTLKSVTASMNRIEKVINWYNKKYNYDVPAKCKEYFMAQKMWDSFKIARDKLKTA